MKLLINGNSIISFSEKIERVNEQGEENIIKVWVGDGYYYVGTQDRDNYSIIEYSGILPENFDPENYLLNDGEIIPK